MYACDPLLKTKYLRANITFLIGFSCLVDAYMYFRNLLEIFKKLPAQPPVAGISTAHPPPSQAQIDKIAEYYGRRQYMKTLAEGKVLVD